MESFPPHETPLLVVDDDEGLLLSIKAALISAGLPEPALLSDSRRALDLLRAHRFQVVLLELMMPSLDGMDILTRAREEFPEIDFVVVSAVDDAPTAVRAMRAGAAGYLVKPVNSGRLAALVQSLLEKQRFREELLHLGPARIFSNLKHPEAFAGIIAEDEAMGLVLHQVEAAAMTDYSVLINGESGTGKEMLARVIHGLSERRAAPFFAVNMAAFSKSIFEEEFFGHAKGGAYTDAGTDRRGLFEAANGGTLFLDEITELDPALQAKLLRVIEEREFYRLGSTEVRSGNVRIIAATNRDIGEAILSGRFRADLFYRINTCNVKIPPLRERRRDILPLAHHFMKTHAAANRKKIHELSPELAERLLGYEFPGNVRELKNIMAAAVLLEKGMQLTLASARSLLPYEGPERRRNVELLTLEALERRHIERVLEVTGGNRPKAAKILGINPSTIYRKLEKHNPIRKKSDPN